MKCLQGIKAVVIRSKESSDPALFEGREACCLPRAVASAHGKDSFTHRNMRSAFHPSAVFGEQTGGI